MLAANMEVLAVTVVILELYIKTTKKLTIVWLLLHAQVPVLAIPKMATMESEKLWKLSFSLTLK